MDVEIYEEVSEKDQLDRLLQSVYDEPSFEAAMTKFYYLLDNDFGFKIYFYENFMPWEFQTKRERDDICQERFHNMILDKILY